MSKGFDCATPLTAETANKFVSDGYEFVARYLVPTGWKRLTRQEVEIISSAGIRIVSVFETTADRALGGYDAGYEDGQTASKCAEDVGQPKLGSTTDWRDSAIYFAVDFDPTNDQLQTIIDYIRGANDASPDYATGVYGSYAVCKAVCEAGAASHSMQTYAWSGGQKYDCQIYQYQNDIIKNGIGIDEDESYGGEGWWNIVGFQMKPEDANEIIERFLQHEWDKASDEDKVRRHELADELRKASGQVTG